MCYRKMFCQQIHVSSCILWFWFKNQIKFMCAMIVFIFLNQNSYIEQLLINSEVTMRSVILTENNVGFINAHVFVCQFYILYKKFHINFRCFLFMYVHLAKDKACAFRKRAWVKSFVLNTYIGIIFHRWLGLLSTKTFSSLMNWFIIWK